MQGLEVSGLKVGGMVGVRQLKNRMSVMSELGKNVAYGVVKPELNNVMYFMWMNILIVVDVVGIYVNVNDNNNNNNNNNIHLCFL